MIKIILVAVSAIAMALSGCNSGNNSSSTESINAVVHITGEMRNVMHKGELAGTILLDTISNKSHLYGFGPLEYLQGEVMIVDGKIYVSKVATDSTMAVTENYKVKAPFFAYAHINKWKEMVIPENITTMQQLELFLDSLTTKETRPFLFRVLAPIDSAVVHLVNLPDGASVSSPEKAGLHQKNYTVKNKNVELLGFFSTDHAGIFTHHDTYLHLHLITEDKTQSGHLDELSMIKGKAKLFLPDNEK